MSGYEDDLARWLRDTDKREQVAERRQRELLEAHRQSTERIARAIEDGFKLIHDAIGSASR